MSRFFDADDFFRTFEELNQEPYINFPTADVVDRNECSKCVLHPFKQLREQLETNMVEVVHGEWIDKGHYTYCSICNYENPHRYNYCPECGARMDKGGDAK